MPGVVLITDVDTPLGQELARLYGESGYSVIGTTDSGEQSSLRTATALKQERAEVPCFCVQWSRKSALSARNVLLAGLNRFDRIDQAILVECPDSARQLLHETKLFEIDRAIDLWVKGSLFFAREILAYFLARKSGVFALVNYSKQGSREALPPLESSIRGSIQGLTHSLFAAYAGDGIAVSVFESYSPKTAAFASYICQTILEKESRAAKWYRFPARYRRLPKHHRFGE